MHVRRGFLGWGVFFIVTGAVPLAVRAGLLTEDQIGRIWNLWPLILIGLGVGLILSRTRFDFVGGLIVAATFGLMAGGLLSSGFVGFSTSACGGGNGNVAFPTADGSFSAASASVDVELDCGNLTLGAGSGNAWRIAGQDANGAGPVVDADADSLSVRSRDRNGGIFTMLGDRSSWQLTVPTATRLDIDLQVNAGSAAVGLGEAALGNIDLQLNAGSSTIDLGSVADISSVRFELNAGSLGVTLPNRSMTGSIQANAGSVKLCAPAGAGLRFETGDNPIAAYDYADHGMVKVGSTWTTPGFDAATVRIDLRTEANAGSFSLNPGGGCE